MKKIGFIIVLFLTSFLSYSTIAQNVVTDKPVLDSATASKAVDAAMDLISQEQLLHYRDSLENLALQLQIENTAELKSRRALEEKLNLKNVEDSVRLAKLKAQIEASKKDAIGYPIVIADDTIRLVFTSLGTLSPSQRATISTEKIKAISANYMPAFDSLSIQNEGLGTNILFQDNILITVTQSDAIWEGRDQSEIAREIVDATEKAIVKLKELTSFKTVSKQIVLSLLITIICVILIVIINRAFKKRLTHFLVSKEGTWFKGWRLRDYEFLNAHKQVKTSLVLIKFVRLTLSVLIFFIALTLLFSIFPVTERLAGVLFGWITSPVKSFFWAIIKYLPDLFIVIIISLVMKYILRAVKYFMNEIAEGKIKINGFYADWADSTYNILKVILYAFGLVMIFPHLPLAESDTFKGVSIFLGVIVSFGSSSMISSLIAGLIITYMRPFKVGDHIKIGDTTGDVLEKTPFVTRIKTYKQEVVTIPNSTILASSVLNYSTSVQDNEGVIFHTIVTMGYETPWRVIHKALIEAASRSEYVLKTPAPFVLQTSLDDFYVSYQLCVYSKNPEKQARIYSQLNTNIQDVFNENNLELLSPHFRALKDEGEIMRPREATMD